MRPFSTSRRLRRKAKPRHLAHEQLEQRLPLAGNVSAVFSDGRLTLQGDAQNNDIHIAMSGGNLVVTGQANTTINGSQQPFVVTAGSRIPRGLFIDLGAGNDAASLEGFTVGGRLRLRPGAGNDRVTLDNITANEMQLHAGAGNDVVEVDGLTTRKWASFHLEDGDDVLALEQVRTGGDLVITGGNGDDTVAVGSVSVSRKLYFGLADGDDEGVFFGQTFVGRRADVGLGAGDDFFAILPDQTDGVGTFWRRLKVWLGPGDDNVATDDTVSARRIRIEGAGGMDTFQNGATARSIKLKQIDSRTMPDMQDRIDAVFASLVAAGVDTSPFGDNDTTAPLGITVTSANGTYTENDGEVNIDAALTLQGGSSSTLTGATVAITSGFVSGQDELRFTSQTGITATFNATTGVLTLSGNASLTAYQTMLRSVRYINTSENPTGSSRQFTFTVQRGTDTATAARTFNLIAENDAPDITLSATSVTVDVEDLPQILDDAISVEDVDDDNLISITIRIASGYQSAEDRLTITGQPAAITAQFDVNTGTLTLSGTASLADYQAALRLVTYENLADDPTLGTRSIQFTANDGTDTGTATLQLSLTGNTQAPVIQTTSEPLQYTENDGAVAVDPQLTVTDADSTTITSATVEIIDGLAVDEDRLAFVNALGITGTYNAATGTLTLTGTATLADYQTALRSVTYENTSEDPSDLNRIVRFTVNDGAHTGSATRTIVVVPVNDPLDLIVPPSVPANGTLQIELGSSVTLDFIAEDLDDSQFTFQLDLEDSGIPDGAALPMIDAATGTFTWQPTTTGVFHIRILVVNESGQADQELITIEVTSLDSTPV